MAAEGAHVTLADIDMPQAQRVAEAAREVGAASVDVVRCDVTELDEVKALFSQVQSTHGGLDVLVNCVGWDDLMFFTQTTPEFWDRIIRINFVGVLNCTSEALTIMAPQGRGAIVSISSDASRQGEPREAVYGAMKAGVSNFMKTIARENGRNGIRCNAVCPGVTVPDQSEVGDNSMWAEEDALFNADQKEAIARSLPLKRLGTAEDVANAVVFLSSEAAGYITGQVLSVSGGYSMVG